MQEAPYSVTFVTGKPPMITVRGENAEAWAANLDSAAASGALTKIRQINDSLNGLPPGPGNGPAPEPAKPAQELPPGFGTPPCSTCGEQTQLDGEGISKQSGKAYKRFRCTKNQLHKATFTN